MVSRSPRTAGGTSIHLPGSILDELNDRDYSNDPQFNTKKRKRSQQVSRKERRKQQRAEKKRHRRQDTHGGSRANNAENVTSRKPTTGVRQNTHKSQVENKSSKNLNKPNVGKKERIGNNDDMLPFSSDDELSSGDFDEFDEDDLDEEEWKQLRELEDGDGGNGSDTSNDTMEEEEEEGSDADGGSEHEQELTAEETLAKLKALKASKSKENVKPPREKTQKPAERREKASKRAKKETKHKVSKYSRLNSDIRAAQEQDERDMEYWARKLHMRGKKSLKAENEFDAIGGLLEGLDFFENYGEDEQDLSEESSEEEGSEDEKPTRSGERHLKADELPSDDELSSGDFDEFDEDDLDEEEWKQLRELEEEEEGNGSVSSEASMSDSEGVPNKRRENPYVAPASADTFGDGNPSNVYIPPRLREQRLRETDQESAELAEIRKKVKSNLNKLSDSNIAVIVSSLNDLFTAYPRQHVVEIIAKQILDTISEGQKLLDTYIMNYAGLLFALFRLRGVEVGAYFIQYSVEQFLHYFEKQSDQVKDADLREGQVLSKECSNIVTLLGYCYDLGLVSCRLIFDLVRDLVSKPNTLTTDLLLRIVAVSGQLLRGDDPSCLKEIYSELLINVKEISDPSPRLQFLLSTLSDLKNNRLKASVLAADFRPLKKVLSSVITGASVTSESLQVSLDDIKNVHTRGKWWLVGASWKGHDDIHAGGKGGEEEEEGKGKGDALGEAERLNIEDELLNEIPDWGKITREQRMNTDVRRAIFISIMSAQDYLDAFTKLEKLNLKNRQTLEIPKVLMRCLLVDGQKNGYNPYYGLVASKLCEHHHNLLKAFRFLFWEVVKKFEEVNNSDHDEEYGMGYDVGSDDEFDGDENSRLMAIANQGKFFGYLLSEGKLRLDIFKHVLLVDGLGSDGNLFVEVLLFQMLLMLGKKAESTTKTSDGKKEFAYDTKVVESVVENGLTSTDRAVVLRSLEWFLNKKFKYEPYLPRSGSKAAIKRDRRRVEWALEKFKDLIKQNLKAVHGDGGRR